MSVNPCRLWVQSVTSEQSREFQNTMCLRGIYAWGHMVPSAGLGTDLLKSADGSVGMMGEPDACWSRGKLDSATWLCDWAPRALALHVSFCYL